MEEGSKSPEAPQYHVFANALTPDTDPFTLYDDTSLKFVRIDAAHLQEVASKQGWALSPDQSENGIVIVGPDTEYHWQMVSNALSTHDRVDIREKHSYVDSGFIHGWPGEKDVHIMGGSAELKDEKGKIFSDLSKEQQEALHQSTAEMLNVLYSKDTEDPKFLFKVLPLK